MIRKGLIIAGLGALAAMFVSAGPAAAGTCSAVTVKGRAADPATATTRAQIKLAKRTVGLGKVTKTSTNCKQGPLGAECKITAVVCP
jgi:hypothetical protein